MGSPTHATGDNNEHVSNEPRSTPGNSAEPLPERDRRHEPAEEDARGSGSPERSGNSLEEHGRSALEEHGDNARNPGYQPGLFPREVANGNFSYHHTGPIPDPMTLRGYEDILPGAADRVISMAEGDQETVNEVRKRSVKAEAFATIATSIAIPTVQILSLAGSIWLTSDGKTAGSLLAAVPFLGITVSQLSIVFRRRKDEVD